MRISEKYKRYVPTPEEDNPYAYREKSNDFDVAFRSLPSETKRILFRLFPRIKPYTVRVKEGDETHFVCSVMTTAGVSMITVDLETGSVTIDQGEDSVTVDGSVAKKITDKLTTAGFLDGSAD